MLRVSTFRRRVREMAKATPKAKAKAKASRAYHHGNLRRALLDAALDLFVERGAFDFTLRELARKAGVTHNAPYRHFAGKAELLSAVRDEGFAELARTCRAALEEARGDLRARVRVLGEAYVRFAIAHPHHFRLMLHHPLGDDGGDGDARGDGGDDGDGGERGDGVARGEAFDLLSQALDEARDRGVVRKDLSTRELTLGAWALVHGLASLIVAGHVPSDEARLARSFRMLDKLFFDGARARGGS